MLIISNHNHNRLSVILAHGSVSVLAFSNGMYNHVEKFITIKSVTSNKILALHKNRITGE